MEAESTVTLAPKLRVDDIPALIRRQLGEADWAALQWWNAMENARIAQCEEDGTDPDHDPWLDEPREARTREEI